jgi:hypothetical protein
MLVECSAATGFTRFRRFEIQSSGKGTDSIIPCFADVFLFFFEEQYQRVVFETTMRNELGLRKPVAFISSVFFLT